EVRHKGAERARGDALEILHSPATARAFFRRVYAREVGAWGFSVESFSPAARSRFPRELCLRRRISRSRLQRSGFSRGSPHYRWQATAVSSRNRPAREQSARACSPHENRRIIRAEASREKTCPPMAGAREDRISDSVCSRQRPAMDRARVAEGSGATVIGFA